MSVIPYVMLAANIVVWGTLTWLGRNEAVGHQAYYEMVPSSMLVVAIVPAMLFWRVGLGRVVVWWTAITLFAVLPYLFFYTGGM
jgi:hypothetical protein